MVDEHEAPSKIDFKAFIAKHKDPNFPKEDEDQFTPFAKILEELGINLSQLDLDDLVTFREKDNLFTDEQRKLLQTFYHDAFSEEKAPEYDSRLLQGLIWAFQQYCEFEEEMKIDDEALLTWIGSCAAMGLNVLIRDVLTERNRREPKFNLNQLRDPINNLGSAPLHSSALGGNHATSRTLQEFGASAAFRAGYDENGERLTPEQLAAKNFRTFTVYTPPLNRPGDPTETNSSPLVAANHSQPTPS